MLYNTHEFMKFKNKRFEKLMQPDQWCGKSRKVAQLDSKYTPMFIDPRVVYVDLTIPGDVCTFGFLYSDGQFARPGGRRCKFHSVQKAESVKKDRNHRALPGLIIRQKVLIHSSFTTSPVFHRPGQEKGGAKLLTQTIGPPVV